MTGSATLTVPLPTSPGRSGVEPDLALTYDSGAGNGPFGFGWQLGLPSISRRTDRGLPRYRDDDVFVLSGAEDLVAMLDADARPVPPDHRTVGGTEFRIRRFRPRVEGLFARIEQWTSTSDAADTSWRTISRDNITTWYGRTPDSRITDPADPRRIFTWLACESYDDKGNVVAYGYKREDSVGVDPGAAHERHRSAESRAANRYLKHVRYGNIAPYLPVLAADRPLTPLPGDDGWRFQLVLDYGEHDLDAPSPDDPGDWERRPDPFSVYRPGFEVRTYRRCRRALMFHRFPELAPTPTLVRALELTYVVHADLYSFLVGVTAAGYRRDPAGGYTRRAQPVTELTYREPAIDREVHTVTAPHLPAGVDGQRQAFADLDGAGAAGVLSRYRDAWYFAANESPAALRGDGGRDARFGPARPVGTTPNLGAGAPGLTTLLDLAGDGQLDLVQLAPPTPGFAERGFTDTWSPFTPFARLPTVDWADPRLRLADLTGDGLPDLVLLDAAADDPVRWAPSLGEEGFGAVWAAGSVPGGPLAQLNDDRLAVRFADMTGDGLPDLVAVGAGRAWYWPNLGYGRFGARVTMDDAPRLDGPDAFDPRRLILGDIDGTGTADLIYIGASGVDVYLNRSGNGWTGRTRLTGVPPVDDVARVAAVDLLGTGTACLVWSSPLPRDTGAPMRYIDLMGGVKPHLLTGYANGLGHRIAVEYQPSTYFALADARAGTPWATRLPFPVQCVSRVIDADEVRQTTFSSSTTYHEGYFDGVEREFRGFGRVETVDVDVFGDPATGPDAVERQAPVLTKQWFHTGADLGLGAAVLHQLRGQYYSNPAAPELALPEPDRPAGLTDDERREAARALRGVPLRTEVYGLDSTPQAAHPYLVSEATYRLRRIQPRGPNPHAVLLVTPGEQIRYDYERRPADPRVSHAFVLDADELGLVRRSAVVAYPRRSIPDGVPEPAREAQTRRLVTVAEHDYTDDLDAADAYRLRAVCDARGYELTGLTAPAGDWLTEDILAGAVGGAQWIGYEEQAGPGVQLRLLSREQTVFLRDDLTGPLPLGQISALGLVDRTYRLALTAGLVQQAYGGAVTDADLATAGYVHRGDSDWWIPSGEPVYPSDAPNHFYLPSGFRDALGGEVSLTREHDLLVVRTVDPLGNTVEVQHDYHVLAPRQRTDVNGNRSAVAYDQLGVVVATAVMGKPGAGEGDTLDDPTTRVEYDLFRWRDHRLPNRIHTFSREQHGAGNPRWQEQYTYLDGAGGALLSKAQAPPGLARTLDPATGSVVEVDTTPEPRWIGTGRTVFNNKGNPVRQYEAYYSATPEYEDEPTLVQVGVSQVLHYDPLDRAVRVDLADGTFTRTDFDPWHERVFDRNDTVLDSLWYAERGSPDPAGPEPADPQQRAAWLAAAHADTPAVVYLDTLGRAIVSIADNGPQGRRRQRRDADLTGRHDDLYDARDRLVGSGLRDLVARTVRAASAERGARWILTDVLGNRRAVGEVAGDRIFRTRYDELHRTVSVNCRHGGVDTVLTRIVYGEGHAEATARNLRGTVYQSYDQTGAITADRYDFKGNLLGLSRRFTKQYMTLQDWSALEALADPAVIEAAAAPALEDTAFAGTASYDALDRTVSTTLSDGSVLVPGYDVSNRLATLGVQLAGQGPVRPFLLGQEYDAKGQRLLARLANGTRTDYAYDPATLRLTSLVTRREVDGPAAALQGLAYTYDPVGNLTQLVDSAQQTRFFDGAVAAPEHRFRYDALYQLVAATGRELAALTDQVTEADSPLQPLPHPNDTAAVRPYTETYEYDDLGNITLLRHTTGGAGGAGWTRRYRYAYQDDAADRTNRLVATSLPGDDPAGPFHATYGYDNTGNMTSLPHLPTLDWDALDHLHRVDLGGGGTAYYVYGGAGHRMRAVVERQGGLRTERRYLGPLEIYEEYRNDTLRLRRTTLHVADEQSRIARVDTTTVDTEGVDPAPVGTPVIRYTYTNHLGSAVLETDEQANPVTYEEYLPYGSTAYRAATSTAGASLKRYRFAGSERDAETGLNCIGARFYATWLGRWTSADPAGFADGINLFAYCRNNPTGHVDPTGTQGQGAVTAPSREELVAAWQNDRGSFQAVGEPVVRGEIRWQAYVHPTYGRVYLALGPSEPYSTIVWGGGEGPPLFPESRWLTRFAPPAPPDPRDKPVTTGAGATTGGKRTVAANPEGFTLEVPNNYDDAKIKAYKERITSDRGVGHRSAPPGGGSRTKDIRSANQALRNNYEAQLPGGQRPPGTDIDHTVELQHIIRGNNTVRPQDHRVQASSTNQSQGRSGRNVADRQIASGVPEDVPAGGVARSSEMGRLANSESLRTVLRGLGYGLIVAGPALTAWGAWNVDNPAVRATGLALSGVEAGGVAYYIYGRTVLGGGAAGTAAGRAAMAAGGRVAAIAGGAAQAIISGYLAYEDYQRGDWRAFGFDAAAAVGGVALALAAVVTSPAWALGLAIFGILTGIAAGIFHLGRWLGWWD